MAAPPPGAARAAPPTGAAKAAPTTGTGYSSVAGSGVAAARQAAATQELGSSLSLFASAAATLDELRSETETLNQGFSEHMKYRHDSSANLASRVHEIEKQLQDERQERMKGYSMLNGLLEEMKKVRRNDIEEESTRRRNDTVRLTQELAQERTARVDGCEKLRHMLEEESQKRQFQMTELKAALKKAEAVEVDIDDHGEEGISRLERISSDLYANLGLLAGIHASSKLPKARDKASFDKLLKVKTFDRWGNEITAGGKK